jgi:hypothetical protein
MLFLHTILSFPTKYFLSPQNTFFFTKYFLSPQNTFFFTKYFLSPQNTFFFTKKWFLSLLGRIGPVVQDGVFQFPSGGVFARRDPDADRRRVAAAGEHEEVPQHQDQGGQGVRHRSQLLRPTSKFVQQINWKRKLISIEFDVICRY